MTIDIEFFNSNNKLFTQLVYIPHTLMKRYNVDFNTQYKMYYPLNIEVCQKKFK